MPAPRTARVLREERRARTSLLLRGALERHGVTQAHVAADTGAGLTKVAQWCDPEADPAISVADAQVLPAAIRVEIVEAILGEGYVVSQAPAVAHVDDDLRTAARIAQAGGELVAGYVAACADGTLDRAEAADLRARVHAHIRELRSLEHALEEAEKRQGRPVQSAILRAVGGR